MIIPPCFEYPWRPSLLLAILLYRLHWAPRDIIHCQVISLPSGGLTVCCQVHCFPPFGVQRIISLRPDARMLQQSLLRRRLMTSDDVTFFNRFYTRCDWDQKDLTSPPINYRTLRATQPSSLRVCTCAHHGESTFAKTRIPSHLKSKLAPHSDKYSGVQFSDGATRVGCQTKRTVLVDT